MSLEYIAEQCFYKIIQCKNMVKCLKRDGYDIDYWSGKEIAYLDIFEMLARDER
jgi:hypothetical protein